MRTGFAIAILAMPLAGCTPGQGLFDRAGPKSDIEVLTPAEGQTRPRVRPSGVTMGQRPPEGARTAEEFDTTTEEERLAAVQTAQSGAGAKLLGTTIASLGAPSEAGIWMKTPLVSAPAKGRVEDPASGAQVAVDLLPLDAPRGAGSQLSLAAMRLLGVGLTELPEVKVYRLN
ncbi:hypothetical protein FDP25_02820 [Roseovarius sp. A21]|uniref:D-galactarate dehydratase n=1 Tax=Roseovarius bejariae TaxID=2576383 RepID=A0A844CSZ9_9RHOB|nr:hypothetical protein [Roseovarius bejariae]MRU14356.1 hypothetical protein [Roseovarius bejariae]